MSHKSLEASAQFISRWAVSYNLHAVRLLWGIKASPPSLSCFFSRHDRKLDTRLLPQFLVKIPWKRDRTKDGWTHSYESARHHSGGLKTTILNRGVAYNNTKRRAASSQTRDQTTIPHRYLWLLDACVHLVHDKTIPEISFLASQGGLFLPFPNEKCNSSVVWNVA